MTPSSHTRDGPKVDTRLEFRPDEKGEFDEIVAAFADGSVHVETMSDQGCYVGFYWDDGRYCQWWIGVKGRSKLTYQHDDGHGNPPKFPTGYARAALDASGEDELPTSANVSRLAEALLNECAEHGWSGNHLLAHQYLTKAGHALADQERAAIARTQEEAGRVADATHNQSNPTGVK